MTEIFRVVDEPGLERLNAFAATFSHNVPHLGWPLYLVNRKGTGDPLGYFQIVNEPTVYPAIGPTATARETLETTRAIREAVLAHSNSVAMVVPDQGTNFSERIMRHFGFHPLGLRLYLAKR